MTLTLASAISAFGAAAEQKLASITVAVEPEDQLRAPFEQLLADMAELAGIPRKQVSAIGESALSVLKTRPDYAVTVDLRRTHDRYRRTPSRRGSGVSSDHETVEGHQGIAHTIRLMRGVTKATIYRYVAPDGLARSDTGRSGAGRIGEDGSNAEWRG